VHFVCLASRLLKTKKVYDTIHFFALLCQIFTDVNFFSLADSAINYDYDASLFLDPY